MAPPIPKTPTEVLVRVFGKDPPAEILAQDDHKPFERDEQILFPKKWTATLSRQTFGGMGGKFHLFADKIDVTLQVWFRILGENADRRVVLEKAELDFAKPYWGGEYFFYCRDNNLPAKYKIDAMPDQVTLEGDWCKRNKGKACTLEAYYEHANSGEEKWSCDAVQRFDLKRVIIEEDGEAKPDVDADVVISARPQLFPRVNHLKINNRDIDKIIYGAFIYAGISDWVESHRRHNDVTAVLVGFFEAFVPERSK